MTPRILGLNLSLDHTPDTAVRDDFTRQLQAAYTVVMVDGLKDISKIIAYQQAHPYTTVIGRVYVQDENGQGLEGSFHLAPKDPKDAGKQYVVSPLDWMNAVGELGKGQGWVYCQNEPSGEMDEDTLDRLVKWTEEWMQLALIRGVKAVIFNFGDRHPRIIGGRWEIRYRGILRLASQHPHLFKIGLHSYGDDALTEHLEAYVQTCKELTITPPECVISEFGLDTHAGSADGYKARGWSGEKYAAWCVSAVNGELRPYIEAGVVVGINLFCWNANPRWKDFDVSTDNDWQWFILAAAREGKFDIVVKPATKPAAQFVPKPPDAKWPKEYVVRGARTIRSGPSSSYPMCGELTKNDVVTIYDFPATPEVRADGNVYNWKWVESSKGNGWATVTGWGLAELKPTVEVPVVKDESPVITPPPDAPPPPPEPEHVLTITPAQLEALIAKIAEPIIAARVKIAVAAELAKLRITVDPAA